ncbi:hypothetical protein D9757_000195 [Collybiopsis confluens]|uniref:C2 domain-containing protein n=1 Tax=Collybiopsis confluens TaxID=2823264 RepID=A0A8H5MHI0_9AGAR|nr:hypothetical protein D9757_000195 [Collybiopsis confluens]
MATTPREIGTLVVVVLKANHLPNKRHIGKQDPYCAVTFNGQTRRTKAVKKGGQHPEWDEEIRFQLYEDEEESSQSDPNGTPPPLPPKNDKNTKLKGGMFMKLACYADDAREPDLIGEGFVDLTEVVTKGESDEWYTLTYKERFAGKVYLEMTLYSNEPEPPKKKKASTLPLAGEYIGPGVFTAESPGHSNRASTVQDHNRRQSDSYSMRPSSSSLAQLDLYQAPYEQDQSVDSLTRNFGEFGLSDGRRRETLPSSMGSYRSVSSAGFSTISSQSSSQDPNGVVYRPVTPNSLPSQVPYPSEYDAAQPSTYRPLPSATRKARYSIPVSSSGFMPLSTSGSTLQSSNSSVFNMPHPSNSYLPPPSQTPIPSLYNPVAPASVYEAGGYPLPSHTPFPVPLPVPSQTPFPTSYSGISRSHLFDNEISSPPLPESHMYPYQGAITPSQLIPPGQPSTPENFTGYTTPSPSRDGLSSSSGPGGSRPLPPQPQGAQPPPLPSQQPYSAYSYMAPQGANGLPAIPPPPPIPGQSHSPVHGSPQSHFTPEGHQISTFGSLSVPPPPPHTPLRRVSLPQPPMSASSFSSLPAPPSDFRGVPPPPPPLPPAVSHSQQPFYPGPPPRPPAQSIYYNESQSLNPYSH